MYEFSVNSPTATPAGRWMFVGQAGGYESNLVPIVVPYAIQLDAIGYSNRIDNGSIQLQFGSDPNLPVSVNDPPPVSDATVTLFSNARWGYTTNVPNVQYTAGSRFGVFASSTKNSNPGTETPNNCFLVTYWRTLSKPVATVVQPVGVN